MCGSIPDSKQCKAKKLLPLGPFGLIPSQLHEFVPKSAALTSNHGLKEGSEIGRNYYLKRKKISKLQQTSGLLGCVPALLLHFCISLFLSRGPCR